MKIIEFIMMSFVWIALVLAFVLAAYLLSIFFLWVFNSYPLIFLGVLALFFSGIPAKIGFNWVQDHKFKNF